MKRGQHCRPGKECKGGQGEKTCKVRMTTEREECR
jgi:hypothetical protein